MVQECSKVPPPPRPPTPKKLKFNKAVLCFIRKIKIKVNRRFDVPNIILKIEVVYAYVKVVMRELKILNIQYAHSTVLDVM